MSGISFEDRVEWTKDVLVVCWSTEPSELSLIQQAARLAACCGARARALLLDTGNVSADAPALLCQAGAARVTVLNARQVADDLLLARELAALCRELRPGTVLCNATVRGRAVMPMAAALLGTGLTADCTGLEMAPDGVLTQMRPAYGNHVAACILCTTRPQMATVRPGIFQAVGQSGEARKRTDRRHCSGIPRVKEIAFAPSQAAGALTDAPVVFAGGMGLGGAEGFARLERLAALCGGGVGATRAAVSDGYAPYTWQVGQTGVVVRPRLYVALGISGAVQHLAGMSGAGIVVAVNTDRRAPIFDYADYGIVADWRDVADFLEKFLKEKFMRKG
ncbi:MAG: electron transfer flavoprotein subunit alpha/FixB family protein [Ruminococcaceae bacterium]|nr:electron transfer flavoprotein subunit alpha/FixB family protein [Oscillospiraceae bacterium]